MEKLLKELIELKQVYDYVNNYIEQNNCSFKITEMNYWAHTLEPFRDNEMKKACEACRNEMNILHYSSELIAKKCDLMENIIVKWNESMNLVNNGEMSAVCSISLQQVIDLTKLAVELK